VAANIALLVGGLLPEKSGLGVKLVEALNGGVE
jgi:hypothetical protein